MTLRYGLIGCGMMGQEHIRNIELLDDTQITVVFEPDAQMRAQAAKALPNATMVDSLDALLAFEARRLLGHCQPQSLPYGTASTDRGPAGLADPLRKAALHRSCRFGAGHGLRAILPRPGLGCDGISLYAACCGVD